MTEKSKRKGDATPATEEPRRSRPRRACRDAPVRTLASASPAAAAAAVPSLPLKGKVLVVHANGKTYGRGGDGTAAADGPRLAAAKRSKAPACPCARKPACPCASSASSAPGKVSG